MLRHLLPYNLIKVYLRHDGLDHAELKLIHNINELWRNLLRHATVYLHRRLLSAIHISKTILLTLLKKNIYISIHLKGHPPRLPSSKHRIIITRSTPRVINAQTNAVLSITKHSIRDKDIIDSFRTQLCSRRPWLLIPTITINITTTTTAALPEYFSRSCRALYLSPSLKL